MTTLEELEKLLTGLRAIVASYEKKNPLRTADFHGEGCSCHRCAVDGCSAAINALPGLVARLRELERIETAARVYYENYLKDEAAEDGVEMTGCSEHQHALAYDLRLALKGTST